MTKKQTSTDNTIKIVIAILGVISAVGVAYITYLGITTPIKLSMSATQTAEGRVLVKEELRPSTGMPTQILPPTETITPTMAPTLTPTPPFLVDTSTLMGWVPNFTSSNGNTAVNNIDTIDNAIELTYDIGKDGYVIISKSLNARELSNTEGIIFHYKGRGRRNTIEVKLILRYPDDTDDTTYGILLPRATDTDNKWLEMKVLYRDMECWWPAPNCALHENLLDQTMIDRLDFAISNKPGDDPGSGWVQIKDILEIKP